MKKGQHLRSPWGFTKFRCFAQCCREAKPQKIPQKTLTGVPTGILDLLVKTPVLETTSVSRASWGQIQTRAGFIWGLEVSQLLQRIRLGQATWDLSEIKWALGKVQEPYFPGFPQTLKTGSELKRTRSENQNISVPIKEIPKLPWGLKCLLIVPVV